MQAHNDHESLDSYKDRNRDVRSDTGSCREYTRLSRRRFLGSSAAAGAAAASLPAWMPKVAFAGGGGAGRDVMVSVYLRGGMDGLTGCVPYGDGDLYVYRPTLAVQPPGQTDGAIDLDGFFGLAPASAPLLTPWNDGRLLIVHAAGSPDPTRSHFDAQHYMETATPMQPSSSISTGWLGRHLDLIGAATPGAPLRGVGLSAILAQTLRGAPDTLPIQDPASFAFPGQPATAPLREVAMGRMYANTVDPLRSAAAASLASFDTLAGVDFAGYVPENGALYPAGNFGDQLRSAATMIKGDIGLEAAHIDLGGWDHHSNMGPINGILATLLDELARGLEAFYLDMLGQIDNVVVVVMTEFGRRIRENQSSGTDHGHGGVMFAMGGHINGGQVLTSPWPGVDASSGSGDMTITIDYRDVLAEILEQRMGASDLDGIFPGHLRQTYGVVV